MDVNHTATIEGKGENLPTKQAESGLALHTSYSTQSSLYAASASLFAVACTLPDLMLILIAWYGELCLLST